jgi:hypothetical protein
LDLIRVALEQFFRVQQRRVASQQIRTIVVVAVAHEVDRLTGPLQT